MYIFGMIYKAISDSQILSSLDVMAELRPHLVKENFLSEIRAQEAEGFKLACLEDDGKVVAVAGYRIFSNLAFGRHIYIDDLVTTNSVRSKGYGVRLLDWLKEEARRENCSYFTLDSATHRHQAHKFYFKHNMTIAAYHFIEKL